jgi:hypothetical protein
MSRKSTPDYNLAVLHPDVAKEWHSTKNKDLTAKVVTPGSNRKVWWQCKKGHEWETKICNRTKKKATSCPFCYGRYPTKENNLSVRFPDLLKEWHPEKNKTLTPDKVSPKSHKRVWWVCKRGHEWESVVYSRTTGVGCPYCKPQISKLEIRILCEFKSIFDEVVWGEKQFGYECDLYLPNYNLAVEIDGYPWHEGKEKSDVKKTDKLSEKGVQLFRLRHRKLKKITSNDVFFDDSESELFAVKTILRKINQNHCLSNKHQSKIENYLNSKRLRNEKEYNKIISHLPYALPGKSLLDKFPDISKEWNHEKNTPLVPASFLPGSHFNAWWVCREGHEWEAIINTRTMGGTCCPYCSGRFATIDNNLARSNPGLAKEWHPTKNDPLKPNQVLPGSGKRAWWVCRVGHEWKTMISRRNMGAGCPTCHSKIRGDLRVRGSKQNRQKLGETHPNLAKEWHQEKNGDVTPFNITPGSNKKFWWVCEKGHEWIAIVGTRTRGSGCPHCYKEKRYGLKRN